MSRFRFGIVLGVVIGLVGVGGLIVWRLRDPIAPLHESDLQGARQKWSAQGPANYTMQLVMTGDAPGRYDVEVRQSRVVALRRNGEATGEKARQDEAAWKFWTVEGLFSVMQIDLDAIRGSGLGGDRLYVSAEFDAVDGRPVRYRRLQFGARSASIEWKMSEFRKLP